MVPWTNRKGQKRESVTFISEMSKLRPTEFIRNSRFYTLHWESWHLDPSVLMSCWKSNVPFKIWWVSFFRTLQPFCKCQNPNTAHGILKPGLRGFRPREKKVTLQLFNKEASNIEFGEENSSGEEGNYFCTEMISSITHLETSFTSLRRSINRGLAGPFWDKSLQPWMVFGNAATSDWSHLHFIIKHTGHSDRQGHRDGWTVACHMTLQKQSVLVICLTANPT